MQVLDRIYEVEWTHNNFAVKLVYELQQEKSRLNTLKKRGKAVISGCS